MWSYIASNTDKALGLCHVLQFARHEVQRLHPLLLILSNDTTVREGERKEEREGEKKTESTVAARANLTLTCKPRSPSQAFA